MTETNENYIIEEYGASTVTISGFLKEKLLNFHKFLSDIMKNNELIGEIEKLKNYPLATIIFWIQNDLLPYKDNINEYTNKLFLKYNIIKEDIAEENYNKINRYFLCFIDCINN